MSKKVSILGCGWLGLPLAEHLVSKGFEVKGSTTTEKKRSKLEALGVDPYLIFIGEDGSKTRSFLECDTLIIAVTAKELTAHQKLAEEVTNSDIRQVIYISSTSVYPKNNVIVNEKSEIVDNPISRIEEVWSAYISDRLVILRFAGLMGYDRHPGNWFKEDREIPDPEGFVNLIHRDDCIGIITELIEKEVVGKTYNACAATHPTRKAFYRLAFQSTGRGEPNFSNKPSKYKIVSKELLKTELDYRYIYDDVLKAIERCE